MFSLRKAISVVRKYYEAAPPALKFWKHASLAHGRFDSKYGVVVDDETLVQSFSQDLPGARSSIVAAQQSLFTRSWSR